VLKKIDRLALAIVLEEFSRQLSSSRASIGPEPAQWHFLHYLSVANYSARTTLAFARNTRCDAAVGARVETTLLANI
jgi:hypothetical protein